MNFYCHNHQGKGDAYIQALRRVGYDLSDNVLETAFLLIDIDVPGRLSYFRHYRKMGKPVFLYPHTGRPILQWDGMYPPHPHVTAIFTTAQGGHDIPRMYGFDDKPIHPVGWTFCEQKEFQPCEYPKKVLYAPIHVNGNGFMTDRERETNIEAFRKLLQVEDIELTVRYLHNLEWNGLWEVEGVTYVQGETDQSTKEIDEADVVISHQNMGYLAVARGKPSLFMAEHNVPISANRTENIKTVKSWDKYKDAIMFPLDILEDEDARTLLNKAGMGSKEVESWRNQYIGKPFDEELFVDILESYL